MGGHEDHGFAAGSAEPMGRSERLRASGPELLGAEPCYECRILTATATIAFEEFDHLGEQCGASGEGTHYYLGSPDQVLAAVADCRPDDPWVTAVADALRRERAWSRSGRRLRRTELSVGRGSGEMFHVTATANRASVGRHGLDWRQMGAAPGVAGSAGPELPAIFLCNDTFDASFFTEMSRSPSDVWAVRVDDLWVENGPDGWFIVAEPIAPDRLRLVGGDASPWS